MVIHSYLTNTESIQPICLDICAVFITMVSERLRSCSDSVSEPWIRSRPPDSQLQDECCGGGLPRYSPSAWAQLYPAFIHCQQCSSWPFLASSRPPHPSITGKCEAPLPACNPWGVWPSTHRQKHVIITGTLQR